MTPTLTYALRLKLSPDLAFETAPSLTPDIALKRGKDFVWSASINAGPLFQLSPLFSLKPSVSFEMDHGRSVNVLSNFNDIDLPLETNTSFGVGASAIWSFHRQWGFKPVYRYSGIGSKNDYSAHVLTADFVHFW
ncbi:MAG: hypothetical protein H7301_07370 [Cryobacterium sp.]|nr:hypothetical protein [Oligoflexia bacterium]